jgi:hypothetical protein
MGTFNFSAPISYINSISSESSSSLRFVSFHTSYFDDPWTLPSSTMSYEGQSHIRMEILLSTAEIAYQAIQEATADPDPPSSWMKEMDHVLEPIWVVDSSSSHDFLDGTFPSDEEILEAMTGPDRPWEDLHHRSYFLPELDRIEQDEFRSSMSEIVGHPMVPLDKHDIYDEGNMVNISPTIVINIS